MTRSPERDVRSNLRFSVVTWQSKVESDFAWIMFRIMTKIKAKCSCNRRIMSDASQVFTCVYQIYQDFTIAFDYLQSTCTLACTYQMTSSANPPWLQTLSSTWIIYYLFQSPYVSRSTHWHLHALDLQFAARCLSLYSTRWIIFRHARTGPSPFLLYSFLFDPDLMDDRYSDRVASEALILTDNRRNFRDEVIGRDGTRLVTGISQANHIQACHIVPHSKGHQVCAKYHLNNHQYLINLANHRHEGFNPPLDSINDVRNGILLNQFHTSFVSPKVAFLHFCFKPVIVFPCD